MSAHASSAVGGYLLPFLLTILGSISIQSQPAPSNLEGLSLDDAVRLAIQHDHKLKAAFIEASASDAGVRAARALANPEVTITPSLTRAGSDEEFLVRQPLEINGTRSPRAGIAEAKAKAARAMVLSELQDLVHRTKRAYFGLVRAIERRSVLTDIAKGSEELDTYTARQVELGSRPGVDLVQTRIELTRTRQQLALVEAEYASAIAQLNALVGRPFETPISVPSLATTRRSIDAAVLIGTALSDRPELALVRANRDAYSSEARRARAEGLPDIAPQFRSESLTGRSRESGFGIGISIPIFDHGSRKHQIRQAEQSARAQEQRLLAAQVQIRLEVHQAIAKIRASERVLEDYEKGLLEDVRRSQESSRAGFRLGQTSIVSLLEAQRTYLTVRNDYIDALVDHELAWAELDRAVGSVPQDLIPTTNDEEERSK